MENQQSTSESEEMKTCSHCRKEIPKKATRCSYCQADLREWYDRHPVLLVFGVIILWWVLSSIWSSVQQAAFSQAGTTQGAVESSSAAPKTSSETSSSQSWHVAYTYSNDSNMQTPPFALKGKTWRISYSCAPLPGMTRTSISGNVESANNGTLANMFANNVACPVSQTTYAYGQNQGQYYLSMEPLEATYKVTVEDYY